MTYEAEVVDCINRFVTSGDLCVDVGAGTGTHTRRLAELVGPSGQVIAFEPDSRSYELLLASVGGLDNVRCLKTALWSCDTTLRLWSVEALGFTSIHRYDNHTGSEMVPACALDRLLTARPRLIKIDAEGSEEEIAAGAVEVLTRGVDCVIVELNFHILELRGRSDHGIRNFMAGLGYSMFVIGAFPPVRVEPPVELRLAGGFMVNVLFSTEDKVRQRWPVAH